MNERRTLVASVFSAVGGVSGVIAIALVIWRGGAMAENQRFHEVRLTTMEGIMNNAGSLGLQKHVAIDDARSAVDEQRIERLEAAIAVVVRLEAKVDALKESLEEHKRTIMSK
jgi:predicted membrane chloride channel (bestrophin family)